MRWLTLSSKIVETEALYEMPMDVFAPCALGGILTAKSIPRLKTEIVAGGANNQLLDEDDDAKRLLDRKILYAPDYVINAGGLINVAHELKGYDETAAKLEACGIYDKL